MGYSDEWEKHLIKLPKFKLSIVKHDGVICYRTVIRDYKGCSKATNTVQINPMSRIKHRVKWILTEFWYKITKKEYMLCQGCGEGIAKFRIRDPNHGHGNERYNCCQGCVDFYDWRWSAMDIVDWKQVKEYIGTITGSTGKKIKKDFKLVWKPICKKGIRCIEVPGGQRANEKRIKAKRKNK